MEMESVGDMFESPPGGFPEGKNIKKPEREEDDELWSDSESSDEEVTWSLMEAQRLERVRQEEKIAERTEQAEPSDSMQIVSTDPP